jgi:hypothetical protein
MPNGRSRACGLVGISRSLFHYESRRRMDDEALTGRMMAIEVAPSLPGLRVQQVLGRLKEMRGLSASIIHYSRQWAGVRW